MADFFSSRLLRWLTVPARSRVFTLASKPFYTVADRILGSQFLQDIAEFFLLFQTMYDGFVERARAVDPHAVGQAHDVRGGLDAGGRAGAGGRVLHRGAAGARLPAGGGRAQQGAARPGSATGRRPAVAQRLCADGRAAGRRPWPAATLGRRPRWPGCWARWGRASSTSRSSPPGRPSSGPSWATGADVVATVPYADHDITDLAGPARARRVPVALTAPHAARIVPRWPASPSSPGSSPGSTSRRSPTSSGWRPAGGCSPTSASPTCCCSASSASRRDERRQPLRRAGPGPPDHGPDRVPGRLGRHGARGGGPPAGGPGLPAGRDHRGRDRPSRRCKERVRVLCIPVRYRGTVDRRPDPGVRARRSAASPASSSAPTSTSSTASPA